MKIGKKFNKKDFFGGDDMKDNKYLEVRNKMVRKANELIQRSRFHLSIQQYKIILYMVSQINQSDDDFKLYEFSIQDFCRVCGIDETNGKNYRDLKAAIKELRDKSVWVKLIDGRETTVSWINRPYIDEGSGIIQIQFDEYMKPFLLQLKENFTQYELFWTLRFKSKYTIRLYELIASIHYHDLETYERIYPLEELKRLLGAENYKTYQHFKERVLDPATNEINRYSNKNLLYEAIKSGRSVSKIKLTISSKDTFESAKLRSDIEKELGFDQMTLWDKLEDKGLV